MKAITTTYHGPGNVRGSRIIASDSDNNRAIVHYDCSLDSEGNHDSAAIALCRRMNWHGTLVRGSLRHGNVYVWLPARAYRETALVRVQKEQDPSVSHASDCAQRFHSAAECTCFKSRQA